MRSSNPGEITLDYHVDSVHNASMDAEVEFMGGKVISPVPAIEVHLVNADETYGHGTITVRLMGPQVAAGRAAFIPGQGVTVTFAATGADTEPTVGATTENLPPIPEDAEA